MNDVCSACGVNTKLLGRHVPGCKLGPAEDTFDKFMSETDAQDNTGMAVLGRGLTEAVATRTVKLIDVVIVPDLIAAGLPADSEELEMLREVAHQVSIASTAIALQVLGEQGLLDSEGILKAAKSLEGGFDDPDAFRS